MSEGEYIYAWANNPVRAKWKGRRCRVLQRLKMNSAVVKFMDTKEIAVVSRNALRKAQRS